MVLVLVIMCFYSSPACCALVSMRILYFVCIRYICRQMSDVWCWFWCIIVCAYSSPACCALVSMRVLYFVRICYM